MTLASEKPGTPDLASRPSVTVVIPHLNGHDALGRCLASLEADSRRSGVPISVIVVDNGSTHLPSETCAPYPFVRLVEEREPGPGPARSHGARLADTPLLAFIDADCTAQPDWLAAILAHFESHPDTAVIGGDVRIARADPARPTAIEAYESVYGYRMKLYVERDHYTATCNMAVRREIFLHVGDFAGIQLAEDVDWGRRATAMGYRIDYVPEMRIETPARESFAELARKWDRHIGHDFSKVRSGKDRLKWVARAVALAASPLAETGRIMRSDRLNGLSERWLGLTCLTRIRLYRCRKMLGLLAGFGRSSASAWRNEG
ncbi:MAG: glycosyltransferase [Maritimibacter sp.]|nr:glycosyltransferase [Maritimibacter sp.]